jgi:hypothetical protein
MLSPQHFLTATHYEYEGPVSGSGGLAVSGGTLTLGGLSSYTGTTWVHHGNLSVDGDIQSSEAVTLGSGGILTGSGFLPRLEGRGWVAPSGTMLTARSVDGSQGLSFQFTFGNGGFSDNDTLRLTEPTPFTESLTGSSTIQIYLLESYNPFGQRWKGGFFTDAQADFLPMIENAVKEIYVWENGEYRLLTETDGEISFETAAHTYHQNGITVEGRVLELVYSPSEGTYEYWAAENFPPGTDPEDMDPFAAPNSAGVSNLVSYGHGWDPLDPDLSDRPFSSTDGEEFIFSWWENPEADGVTRTVQFSQDLMTWEDSGLIPVEVGLSGGKVQYEVTTPFEPLRFYRVNWALADQP